MGSMVIFVFLFLFIFHSTLSAHVHPHSKERTADAFGNVHHYEADGSHNSEYDHQAILGSKKEAIVYDELPPEEAKRRLKILVTKGGMDSNGDSFVDRDELTNWVLKSFESLAKEEATESFNDVDMDKDGYVTWEEHINYNFESDELKFQDTNEMIHEDKILFKESDIDGDGKLDMNEYPYFNSPEDFVSMHDALFKITMERKDKNNDGFLDFSEFIRENTGEMVDRTTETYIIEKERFEKDLDHDKNGKLDRNEILLWLIPNNDETAASEADHLLSTCDYDEDGKLSVDEIVSHSDIFVGSEATDFGDHLRKMKSHDEL